ncbi:MULTISPECIES: hypothetical protein [Bacillus cereus group]|jgi:hypothetical protein|uniref:Uncharacterized protein n=3 Tax=Bacillus cereus group TaxID=86661 RepID=J8AG42_BACCE|nr:MULTISPECIES: hypothetical protein [Bacillus cereus group]EJQ42122.1 hypothetical protein IEE_04285 [Bacillus cereus BAG5X1-1]EJV59205.1 hypothetical protein IEM_04388 [Bacillus cereus BAG6O-2]EOP74175.1 hypothetical protein IIQ_05104 [Bacillus cereus VD118]MCQ6358922.1 hypothetical protein [Bacillus cereus]WJE26989.1 hypothetical protein QRE65_08910 [Bacillus cereus]
MTFDELKKTKPTTSWVEYDEDGEFFTEENISATNKVLDTYINNLEQLGENPTEVEVMQVVKEVVIKINELNIEHEHFIETMEREDLYDFIDTAARIAGLESEEDITEEWREW